MPSIDGQLFATKSTESWAATNLVEIQPGSSPFAAAGQLEAIQRPLIRGFIDRGAPGKPHSRHWATTFTTELRSTPGTPSDSGGSEEYPEIDKLLRASGMAHEFISGTPSHTYTWLDNPNASASVYSVDLLFEELNGGNSYTADDSNLSFTMQGGADALPSVSWSGVGSYAVPATVASPSSATAVGGTPIIPITAYSIAGETSGIVIRDWTVNSGMTWTTRPDEATTNGNVWPAIGSRDAAVTFSMTIEALDETTFSVFANWAARTLADVTWTLSDGTRSIVITLNAVALNATTVQQGTPNMFTLAGAASTEATGATSSLTLDFT